MAKLVICNLDVNQVETSIEMIDCCFFENEPDFTSVYLLGADKLWHYLKEAQDKVDIVLLHVWRNYKLGAALTSAIMNLYPRIKIFTTSEHPVSKYDTPTPEPRYFISEFVSKPELSSQLAHAICEHHKSEKLTIEVISNGHISKLRLDHIHYVVSDKRLLIFHGATRKLPIYCKLDEIEEQLGSHFIRCHQSYLVNMNQILSFDKNSIELYNGTKIPVSRTRYPHAYASFLHHIGSDEHESLKGQKKQNAKSGV